MKTPVRRIQRSTLCIVHSALCIALFAFCILHSSFCIATPAAAYVQDGLVACWDGVENAGTGVHDASATVWKDLVAGREFTLTGVTVGDNRMTFAGAKTSYGSLNATDTANVFLPATNGTVEVVFASTQSGNGSQTVLQSSTASGIVMTFLNQNLLITCNASSTRYSASYGFATNTTAIRYTSANPAAAFQNAGALSASGTGNTTGSKTTTTIGHNTSDANLFKGHIFCIRVYNRHLTADEIASNRDLDLDRFVRGSAGANDTIAYRKVKIANFDEDLATVYVNGTPAPNGTVVNVPDGDTVTVDARDFRSDWYFAYAPNSQTDRTLALDYWGGLPAGTVSNTTTCTFTPREYLTIVVPNIDCKGHVWHTVDNAAAISNTVYKMAASSFIATKRTVTASTYSAYYAGDKVMDFAMRVRRNGINYTVTSLGTRRMFQSSGVTTIRVAPRLDTAVFALTDSVGKQLTSFVGLADCAMTAVQGYLLYYDMSISGPMSNHVPRVATSIGDQAYGRRPLTGVLPLPVIKTIGSTSFGGCSGITELYSESPNFTSIGTKAFSNASKMKKVTLASPVLSSVAVDAFNVAITNLTYLSAPPASQTPLDNIIAPVAAADGAHTLRVHVPLCTPGWWDLVSEPTAAEVAAGLPERCYGTFVTSAGARKGWMIATDDVDASLVVTDMSQIGNAGYTIHAGLAAGGTLVLSREGFTSCDLQHFNRATGAWETFETVRAASFTYTHDGQLTRAYWKLDGYALNIFSDRHGGTFTISGATPIAGDNIYAPGAVLTITASGRAEHPTSHFTVWTSGVEGVASNSASITITMDADKVLTAAFDPDEWLFDTSTKKITDGEYTSSAAVTTNPVTKSVSVTGFTGGQNYMLWIDLSLPVFVPSEPETPYAVTWLAIGSNTTLRKLRFGLRFSGFNDSTFRGSTVIERLDDLGHTQVKNLPYCFLHDCGSAPLRSRVTYEANDFLPETLVSVGNYWYTGGPYLVGTLRLPNFKTLPTNGGNNFASRTEGVTNLYLTCEGLTTLYLDTNGDYSHFHSMKLQELTIGSTNLVSVKSGSFSGAASTLERLNFLAHAPAAAALNNILTSYSSRTTTSAKPLQIHCSKLAPGWRALKADVDKSSAEWLSRPEGTWGIYQTAANKRFYLVQRDSKYDEKLQTIIFLR